MESVLDIRDLTYTFSSGSEQQTVLHSVSLQLKPAEFVFLTGPSGCGKTTLLTLISGMRLIQQGSIKLLDKELSNTSSSQRTELRSMIGMIFQAHHLISFLTAEENVVLGMNASAQKNQTIRAKKAQARQMLSELGLAEKIHAIPKQLSGGQRQRVAIARALACRPLLLIADEPTASLDAETAQLIIHTLKKLVENQGLSILLTSHDQRLYRYADRILKIDDGRLLTT